MYLSMQCGYKKKVGKNLRSRKAQQTNILLSYNECVVETATVSNIFKVVLQAFDNDEYYISTDTKTDFGNYFFSD